MGATGSGCGAIGACRSCPLAFGPADGDRHLFLRNTSQSPPDRQCHDGRPQRVIRRKHPVVAMPVLPLPLEPADHAAADPFGERGEI